MARSSAPEKRPGFFRQLRTLYTFTQVPDGESAAARLVLVSVIVSFAAMFASEMAARRLRRALGGKA